MILIEQVSLRVLKSNWFCVTLLHYWLRKLTPLCHSLKSKTQTNRHSLTHVSPHFTAATVPAFLLLIGSLDCSYMLLVKVTTVVLVLQHLIENCSKNLKLEGSNFSRQISRPTTGKDRGRNGGNNFNNFMKALR